jgi:Uma2 family endonuclease
MQHAPLSSVSVEDYLTGERTSTVKHEYVAGQVFAMSGVSEQHNVITSNLLVLLREKTRGGPCRILVTDVMLGVEAADAFYYPDIMVCCDPADDDPYVKRSPVVVVEVLSRSTAATDRREKLRAYRQLPSLREYVLIDSIRRRVEVYRRKEGSWWRDVLDEGDALAIESLGTILSQDAIYEGVKFQELREDAAEYAA